MEVKLLSGVRLFVTTWTVAYQASLSMGFSRQEYWSGLPFPPLGDFPDPGTQTQVSCIGRRILYHCATRKAHKWEEMVLKVPSHPQKQAVRPGHRLCREPGDPGLESQLYVSGTVGAKG